MKAEFFIARRYLFSKKSRNVINIISLISLLGVLIATAGLVIVLSVFNGFSDLVVSLYNAFDPDVKVQPVEGKTFDASADDIRKITAIEGVAGVSLTLEEDALITHGDRQFIATIKGVDSNFEDVNRIGEYIIDGEYMPDDAQQDHAVVGSMVAWSLGIALDDPMGMLNIYVPRKDVAFNTLDPSSAFNNMVIKPSGVFAIQQDFDSRYILVPMEFARKVIGEESKVSAIEISLADGTDPDQIIPLVSEITGDETQVRSRVMQHALLNRILSSEKWAVFAILTFILIIAIFNIVSSLNMLILEKKKDMAVLRAMGATLGMARRIFIFEGTLIVLTGALSGILLGFLVCFVQQSFGLVKLENAESFIIDAYPVSMQVMDFIYILCTVSIIGMVASYYSSVSLVGRQKVQLG